ncbi:unnamed protein product, partial [Rotaria sp. Silwood1]
KLLCNVEKFIIHVANNSLDDPNDCVQSIKDFCYGDIDVERLKGEALMIFDFFQSVTVLPPFEVQKAENSL